MATATMVRIVAAIVVVFSIVRPTEANPHGRVAAAAAATAAAVRASAHRTTADPRPANMLVSVRDWGNGGLGVLGIGNLGCVMRPAPDRPLPQFSKSNNPPHLFLNLLRGATRHAGFAGAMDGRGVKRAAESGGQPEAKRSALYSAAESAVGGGEAGEAGNGARCAGKSSGTPAVDLAELEDMFEDIFADEPSLSQAVARPGSAPGPGEVRSQRPAFSVIGAQPAAAPILPPVDATSGVDALRARLEVLERELQTRSGENAVLRKRAQQEEARRIEVFFFCLFIFLPIDLFGAGLIVVSHSPCVPFMTTDDG